MHVLCFNYWKTRTVLILSGEQQEHHDGCDNVVILHTVSHTLDTKFSHPFPFSYPWYRSLHIIFHYIENDDGYRLRLNQQTAPLVQYHEYG
jgi:hypothetical protein